MNSAVAVMPVSIPISVFVSCQNRESNSDGRIAGFLDRRSSGQGRWQRRCGYKTGALHATELGVTAPGLRLVQLSFRKSSELKQRKIDL